MIANIKIGCRNFQCRAWTGGDTPPENFPANRLQASLVAFFVGDQFSDFGECPEDPDTIALFYNRARLDAWRTMTGGFASPVEDPEVYVCENARDNPDVEHRYVGEMGCPTRRWCSCGGEYKVR